MIIVSIVLWTFLLAGFSVSVYRDWKNPGEGVGPASRRGGSY